jgi:hypothetical protein
MEKVLVKVIILKGKMTNIKKITFMGTGFSSMDWTELSQDQIEW